MWAASLSCPSCFRTTTAWPRLRWGFSEHLHQQCFNLQAQLSQLSDALESCVKDSGTRSKLAAGLQAVTRQIMAIGQELTYAKERVALLDEAPKLNGSVVPQQVSSV
jgi:hypothetical protein